MGLPVTGSTSAGFGGGGFVGEACGSGWPSFGRSRVGSGGVGGFVEGSGDGCGAPCGLSGGGAAPGLSSGFASGFGGCFWPSPASRGWS